MRVGFDVTVFYYSRAGVLYYRWRLLQSLLREGREHEFVLLNYRPLSQWGKLGVALDSLNASHARLVTCKGLKERKLTRWPLMTATPWRERLARRVDNWLEPAWQRIEGWSARRNLDRALDGVDVFHCSDVMLHKPPGVRTVVTVYDLTTLLFPEFHVHGTVEQHEKKMRFVREQADAIIAISESTKRDLIHHLSVPAEKITVVHGAADEQYRPVTDSQSIARVARRYGVEAGKYLLHVGTLEPRKNLVRLVQAFGMVQRKYPDYRLLLVGGKGWLHEEIFAEVEDRGLQEAVRFAGFVADGELPALMSGATLFVYPSLYEGFGLPVLEAMACGAPVITSNVSSLPEIAGEAAVLVDPHDVEELAEAMQRLIEDEGARAVLRSQGLAQAARFSWKRAAKQTVEVYKGTIVD